MTRDTFNQMCGCFLLLNTMLQVDSHCPNDRLVKTIVHCSYWKYSHVRKWLIIKFNTALHFCGPSKWSSKSDVEENTPKMIQVVFRIVL